MEVKASRLGEIQLKRWVHRHAAVVSDIASEGPEIRQCERNRINTLLPKSFIIVPFVYGAFKENTLGHFLTETNRFLNSFPPAVSLPQTIYVMNVSGKFQRRWDANPNMG